MRYVKKRLVDTVIIHCSATEDGKDFDIKDIDRWHRSRGWNGCGYHVVIKLDGTVQFGRPFDTVGAHASGHNTTSIGVCYIGGVKDGKPSDTRTPEQIKSMEEVCRFINHIYNGVKFCGHRDLPNVIKACPSFDALYLNEAI